MKEENVSQRNKTIPLIIYRELPIFENDIQKASEENFRKLGNPKRSPRRHSKYKKRKKRQVRMQQKREQRQQRQTGVGSGGKQRMKQKLRQN